MNAILDEHELRGAVERMAARAGTPALPGAAILTAGSRRRTRRRVGAVGAVALAATLAVSVSWSVSGGPSAGPATGPVTTNPFTDQVARTLEEVLPGAKVSAWMFTDTNPATRHVRNDSFPLRITYRGHVSEAFLDLRASAPENAPTYKADTLCHDDLPWKASRPDCVAKDLDDGGILHAELIQGPGTWTARSDTSVLGGGDSQLTMVMGDVTHGGAWALLKVRGGTHSNGSGLTPAMLSAALEDPRFTAFLTDFTAHPEHDPYGPLAPIHSTVVASGSAGTHKWSLSFAVISSQMPGTPVNDNCDLWEYTVDGKSNGDMSPTYCRTDGSTVHNPPPTDAAHPDPVNQLHASGILQNPKDVIGSILTSTVPAGTAGVEATFDDQPAKLTGKVFTVHGDVPYFALVKPDPAKPDWKKATVRCLDADGKEIGKLYFAAPRPIPAS